VNEFCLNFDMENSAFDEDQSYEVQRILKKVSEQVKNGFEDGEIKDSNGNKIGEWSMI